MAVVVPTNRVEAILRAREKSRNELYREIRHLSKGCQFIIKVGTWGSEGGERGNFAQVAVYARHPDDLLPVGDAIASDVINITQHRGVLMELVMDVIAKAEERSS